MNTERANETATKQNINMTIAASVFIVALVAFVAIFVVREITLSNRDMLGQGQDGILPRPHAFSWSTLHRDEQPDPSDEDDDDASSIGMSFVEKNDHVMFCPINGTGGGFYGFVLVIKGLGFWHHDDWNGPINFVIAAGMSTVLENGPYEGQNMTHAPVVMFQDDTNTTDGGGEGAGTCSDRSPGHAAIKKAHVTSWMAYLPALTGGDGGRSCYIPFVQVNYYYTMNDQEFKKFPVLLLQTRDVVFEMKISKIASSH
jgi:hypothetical protein